jgi:hypothetical protein
MPRPIMAAFDQGIAPTIACINKATISLGVEFPVLVNALQRYIDEFFAPVWGTPAQLVMSQDEMPQAWALVFLDDADVAGALGYHDLTNAGLPLSKVFVRTTINNGDLVSVTASHEIAEMLIDPAINMWAEDAEGTMWAYEMADAVEESTFQIDNVFVSNFVYPAYFESFRLPGSRKFDFLGQVQRPFEILTGGYSTIKKGNNVSQIFGSEEKAARFAAEDRRGHRSNYRDVAGIPQPAGTPEGITIVGTDKT